MSVVVFLKDLPRFVINPSVFTNSGGQTPATASNLAFYQSPTLHCSKRNLIFQCKNYALFIWFKKQKGNLLAVWKSDFYVHSSEKMINKYNVGRIEKRVSD